MSIDSIKEIMDGLDPTALLPDLSTLFGRVELICKIAVLIGPVILLIMGLAYLLLSPKEANHYFGYRCYYGMGSIQAWRFTQRLSGAVMGGLGLILTVTMYFISGSFHGMNAMELAQKAVSCLVWEAILIALAMGGINLTAFFLFDRKGEPRRRK